LLKIARYEEDIDFIENWLRANTIKMGKLEFMFNWMLKRKKVGLIYLFGGCQKLWGCKA